ncbi:MAG: 4-hydroxy-3-methylbut-2-enyl diphosphate reductase [Bacteroidaceae bacterium]|nr:4-hydroxy-3-methylbut-2-enyl diphosphate reductase [Bacteroidaceae bacterium]
MFVEIDSQSGFCHGVTRAIKKAEEELSSSRSLYCLGDIVHNGNECDRLKNLGLISVDQQTFKNLHDTTILLRAHGEPPETYDWAERNHIAIIDATCPVVLNLQKRVKTAYEKLKDTQIVIYGKSGHAEVVGLVGQTDGKAIVIENVDDAGRLDFTKNIALFSQTTKSLEGFHEIVSFINGRIHEGVTFLYYDTICRQVSNRIFNIRQFAERHDVILFVSGTKSSNGRVLFNECVSVNQHSHMIADADEIDFRWLHDAESVGICGATSTPKWLMEQCKDRIIAVMAQMK